MVLSGLKVDADLIVQAAQSRCRPDVVHRLLKVDADVVRQAHLLP